MPTSIAPAGAIWVCRACGKTARDNYGEGEHTYGWDESCMLNAILCRDDGSLKRGSDGRVISAEPFMAASDPLPQTMEASNGR